MHPKPAHQGSVCMVLHLCTEHATCRIDTSGLDSLRHASYIAICVPQWTCSSAAWRRHAEMHGACLVSPSLILASVVKSKFENVYSTT